MKIEDDVKLDFADVLIRPKRSNLASRSKVEVRRTFKFKLPAGDFVWSGVPIVAANMDTVEHLKWHHLFRNMMQCVQYTNTTQMKIGIKM